MIRGFLAFFFECYGDHRDLHSFPTRRSSDLGRARHGGGGEDGRHRAQRYRGDRRRCHERRHGLRSEEHTSELQSRQYLVCRLLLEKKKKKKNRQIIQEKTNK